MKKLWRASAVAGLACAAGACADVVESEQDEALEAQAADLETARRHRRPNYLALNLSSAGNASSGNSINDLGWVAGSDNLSAEITHATLWRWGRRDDLGTLGGPNSSVAWPVKNLRGLVVGIAETDQDNPLGEEWSCSAFFPTITRKNCRGFAWERGEMRSLPTLGGYNSYATGANNRKEIVGWAENQVHDTSCTSPQVLQFHAVMWGPGRDDMQELLPLPEDSTSAATAINDSGQVVGISGSCSIAVGGYSARAAVMWEDGVPTDIGNLGGIAWNTPTSINERGDVVGFSNTSPADENRFRARGFLWTRSGGIEDLETLEGDVLSQALGINEQRQVVGTSCTAGFASCRAFLYEDGTLYDLNELIVPYGYHLTAANDINDLGVITGVAQKNDSEERRAFVAIPLPRHLRRGAAQEGRNQVLLGEAARQELLLQLGLARAELAE